MRHRRNRASPRALAYLLLVVAASLATARASISLASFTAPQNSWQGQYVATLTGTNLTSVSSITIRDSYGHSMPCLKVSNALGFAANWTAAACIVPAWSAEWRHVWSDTTSGPLDVVVSQTNGSTSTLVGGWQYSFACISGNFYCGVDCAGYHWCNGGILFQEQPCPASTPVCLFAGNFSLPDTSTPCTRTPGGVKCYSATKIFPDPPSGGSTDSGKDVVIPVIATVVATVGVGAVAVVGAAATGMLAGNATLATAVPVGFGIIAGAAKGLIGRKRKRDGDGGDGGGAAGDGSGSGADKKRRAGDVELAEIATPLTVVTPHSEGGDESALREGIHRAAEAGDAVLLSSCAGVARLLWLSTAGRVALLDEPTVAGETPLLTACRLGHAECVRVLLQHGASATRAGGAGHAETPLHAAVSGGSAECVSLVLEALAAVGGDFSSTADAEGGTVKALDVRNAQRDTPLHMACALGFAAAVDMLLAAGADCERVDGLGRTPLCVAVATGQPDCALRIVQSGRGVGVHTCDARRQWNVLHWAAASNEAAVVTALLAGGYLPLRDGVPNGEDEGVTDPVNARASNGETPSCVAARQGNAEVLGALVLAGGNLSLADDEGKTPMDYAAAMGITLPSAAQQALATSPRDTTGSDAYSSAFSPTSAVPPDVAVPASLDGSTPPAAHEYGVPDLTAMSMPSMSATEEAPSDEDPRETKLRKHREANQKSRQQKRVRETALQREVDGLEADNAEMRTQLSQLEDEAVRLRALLTAGGAVVPH